MDKVNSLTSYLSEHAEEEKASFHMPGHKGSSFFTRLGYCDIMRAMGEGSADFDITEVAGADDLRKAEGVIKSVADSYSELYGSRRTFLSVNGSSAPIMAAVMTVVERGHKLLAAADCHISVKNGAELAGADIEYVQPDILDFPDSPELKAPGSLGGGQDSGAKGMPCGVSPEKIKDALDQHPDIDAVILPSPNYFGIVSDIESIAEEVHKRGKVLIVDQAHGAHLKMFSEAFGDRVPEDFPRPAEELGADIVIDSTHKTMASFTQSAICNVFGDRVDPERFEKTLLMLESTSPSYVLMNSLALNADIMRDHGRELAESWRNDLDCFYENVKSMHEISVLTREHVIESHKGMRGPDFDRTKIVIDFTGLGIDGKEAEELLVEKGIYPEFHSGSIVMFLTGVGNTRADYELLLAALKDISERG